MNLGPWLTLAASLLSFFTYMLRFLSRSPRGSERRSGIRLPGGKSVPFTLLVWLSMWSLMMMGMFLVWCILLTG